MLSYDTARQRRSVYYYESLRSCRPVESHFRILHLKIPSRKLTRGIKHLFTDKSGGHPRCRNRVRSPQRPQSKPSAKPPLRSAPQRQHQRQPKQPLQPPPLPQHKLDNGPSNVSIASASSSIPQTTARSPAITTSTPPTTRLNPVLPIPGTSNRPLHRDNRRFGRFSGHISNCHWCGDGIPPASQGILL